MEEIIELNLNRPWPKTRIRYSSHMDEVSGLITRKPRRNIKEFIEVI